MITIHPWEYDPDDQVGWDINYRNEKKSIMLMGSLVITIQMQEYDLNDQVDLDINCRKKNKSSNANKDRTRQVHKVSES